MFQSRVCSSAPSDTNSGANKGMHGAASEAVSAIDLIKSLQPPLSLDCLYSRELLGSLIVVTPCTQPSRTLSFQWAECDVTSGNIQCRKPV